VTGEKSSCKPNPALSAEERELGMDADITRRDFLGNVVLGTGAALLSSAAPGIVKNMGTAETPAPTPQWHPWTGFDGGGDCSSPTATRGTWSMPPTESATTCMNPR
jgi:hypothetical protein